LVHRLLARQEELEAAVAARDARIVELEAILEKRQRDGKRQAALFSKGKSGDAPASAGRKASRCPSPLPSSPS
jgi:DNA-binding protein H-NS